MPIRTTTRAAVPLLLAVAIALPARAQDPSPLPSPDDPRPLWEAGVVGVAVSQPAYPGADRHVSRALPLPYLLYRGPLLRVDRGSVGVRALRTPRFEFDIGFAASLGARSSDVEARRGMPDIGTLAEFGPRLKINLGDLSQRTAWRVELPLRAVFDVSDSFHHRGVSFEPELFHERRLAGPWRLGASIGAVFGDAKLADTFYGVAPAYATADRPAYEARSGLIATRLGLSLSRHIGDDWRLFAFTRWDSVKGAANESSPLVKRSGGGTVGVALAWSFARSDRPAVD